MGRLFRILGHVGRISIAGAKKRFGYSLWHIFLVLISVGLFLFISWAMANYSRGLSEKGIGYAIGLTVLIILAVFVALGTFVEGVVAQVIVLATGLFGTIVQKPRLYNFFAFLIAAISLGGAAYLTYLGFREWIAADVQSAISILVF